MTKRDLRLAQGRKRLDLWIASNRRSNPPRYQELQIIEHFTFSEREDYEEGFVQVYNQDIAPYLREKETHRQSAIASNKRWIALVLAITAFIAWQACKIDPILPIFPPFLAWRQCCFFTSPERERYKMKSPKPCARSCANSFQTPNIQTTRQLRISPQIHFAI
ncbi:MAG: hypothetical protein QNK92_00715 [Amylibacter sp.]